MSAGAGFVNGFTCGVRFTLPGLGLDEKEDGMKKVVSTVGWVASVLLSVQPLEVAARELPARNLVVEWRVSGSQDLRSRQSGVQQGRVIIDSRRGVVGGGTITYSSRQSESDTQDVQQVMVLNGGRARLFVGRSQQVTTWQWAWGPGFQGVVPQTTWVDLGQGLNVTPRWPGGRAPVVVELEAQSRQPDADSDGRFGGIDPDGQTRRTELASTLSVPLGEWTVVARNGAQTQASRSGTLSTRELDESRSQQLEIRITAP